MKTLVCTVGGTEAPVLAAIRTHRPDRVVFVCSDDDVATGAKGSYVGIERANPSLPTKAQLDPTSWEVMRVPADDPVAIIEKLGKVVVEAIAGGSCVADFTGGTKSMSAGLFYVASQTPGVEVFLVTGPRPDLLHVVGVERARLVPSATVQRRRLHDQVTACWSSHSYAVAAQLIAGSASEVRDDTTDRWEALSRGYARWDAWDHAGALEILSRFGRYTGDLLAVLRLLAPDDERPAEKEGQRAAQRVADILASAERRARAHEYDAAVLRVYRSLEGVAQWTLKQHHQIQTGNVPRDSSIAHLAHETDRGVLVLGCDAAWSAVAELQGPLAAVARSRGNAIRDLALRRNESVLAHGERALDANDYSECRKSLTQRIWPAFVGASAIREIQLPTTLP